MTQERIAQLGGDSTRSTIKVDWLLVTGFIGLGVGIVCLALDLKPELLNALLRWMGR